MVSKRIVLSVVVRLAAPLSSFPCIVGGNRGSLYPTCHMLPLLVPRPVCSDELEVDLMKKVNKDEFYILLVY